MCRMLMKTLSGEEKGALILKNLSPQVADKVLARLGAERGSRLRSLMQRLDASTASREILDQILAEIEQGQQAGEQRAAEAPRPRSEDKPTTVPAPRKEEPAPAPSRIKETKVMPRPALADAAVRSETSQPPEAAQRHDPLALLGMLEPDRLALALQGEHPRTISILLNHLAVERGGEVFKRLSPDLRREVSLQFGSLGLTSLELLERISHAVLQKYQALKDKPAADSPEARHQKMAKLLRMLDKAERADVLALLEQQSQDTARAVKDMLYDFDDLLIIENRSVQKLLSDLDMKNLAIALKGAEPTIKDKVFANLSKRAQESLTEEMDLAQAVTANQIQQAQKVIVDTIQKL